MKKLVLGLVTTVVLMAGVQNIEKYSTTSRGATIYKVTCSNGSTHKYFYIDGEWHKTTVGSIGHRNQSIRELAEWRCSH